MRYKDIRCKINVMRQSTCLVVNLFMFNSFPSGHLVPNDGAK